MAVLGRLDPTRLVAPRECLGCGSPGTMVCGACLTNLEAIAGLGCRRCGNPAIHRDAASCPWCDRLHSIGRPVTTLFAYRDVGRTLFHRIKYEGYWPLIQPLLRRGWIRGQ